jgi:NADPH:quinone reductase-like Zn-dependent oxidoreductase
MRAARISELGAPPALVEVDGPERSDGRALVAVSAVALNPIDINVGAGRFYGGHPDLPYIPGSEAVGRIVEAPTLGEGIRVYVAGGGLGLQRDGTLVEQVAVSEDDSYPLPGGLDDAQAAAAGIAGLAGWMPVVWRAPVQEGDRVLVLGGTGTAGSISVQGAKLLGAAHVVAAGRDPDKLSRVKELGADDVVKLGDDDPTDDFRKAFGDEGPTLVVDMLWGAPAAAATRAAAPHARMVSLGQSAGAEATLASADVRGKMLNLLGYSNFGLPPEVKRAGYLQLVDHVANGRIVIDLETFPLARVADAWQHQASGRKAVVLVGATK